MEIQLRLPRMCTVEFVHICAHIPFALRVCTLVLFFIDEVVVMSIEREENCNGEVNHIYNSDSLTNSSSVAVDIVGCTTKRKSAMDKSSFCAPKELLSPGVSWTTMPDIEGGEGFYSFSGGNVTYNGVSLESTATYTTSLDYLVNGQRFHESTCENDMWTPEAIISDAECVLRDLLNCTVPVNISDTETTLCCSGEDVELCVDYSGISIGSLAVYNTTEDYCFRRNVLRNCTPGLTWSDTQPTIITVSPTAPLRTVEIVFVLGLLFFIPGLLVLAVVGVYLFRNRGNVRLCYWIVFAVGIAVTIVGVALWLSLLGYSVDNEFLKDDGYMRDNDDICQLSSGDLATRTGLGAASFVVAILTLLLWLVSFFVIKRAIVPEKKPVDYPDGGEEPLEGHEMKETYDVLKHPKPSSPRSPVPLLSDTDPTYGKLDQHLDDPDHYGKLDHAHKKKAAVAPAGDSEYGKLDRSKMQEEPGHYGKLDHKTKKTTTLPVDTGSSEYGKLDRTQMQVASGVPGNMYDVVTNEPRHVPSKPRRQHSGH